MVSQEGSDGWAGYWHNYGNRHGPQAARQIYPIESKGAPPEPFSLLVGRGGGFRGEKYMGGF
jgi:hypothetical protein